MRTAKWGQLIIAAGLSLSFSASVTEAQIAKSGKQKSTSGLEISAGIGAFFVKVPDVNLTTVQKYVLPAYDGIAVDKLEDHDGRLDGTRFDAAVESRLFTSGGYIVSGAVSGFYGQSSSTDNRDCVDAYPNTMCYWPAIADTHPGRGDGIFTTVLGEVFQTAADRNVDVWGIALEAILSEGKSSPIEWKAGVDYRQIGQQIDLTSIYVPDPTIRQHYVEDLDTNYWGAYIGARTQLSLWTGGSLVANGKVGLYRADAAYDGYQIQEFPGALIPIDEYQVSLSKQKTAVIASANLELRQDFKGFYVSVFNEFEWYSWAPEIRYNDFDAGGHVVSAIQTGTTISDGSAWTNTIGGRIGLSLD